MIESDHVCWVPIAYAGFREIDGLLIGSEYRGQPVSNRREAWAIARRMCEEIEDGAGFAVKRADEIEERSAYVNIALLDTIGRADGTTIGDRLGSFG
ncbi:hypothetical protein BZM27_39660 [Paraburkholderia steynii]|uniref:Uncharacterized protein n=1 Tax=Paraburkholderia steynii TaxID=1245441 RepID=A0A4V2NGE6_9BURK|nr:hypothetical protein BZM27_39660 [Paraburkholderia steynii]